MLDTGVVATWVGLLGVLAGALIAFGSQYLVSKTERQERNVGLLLEQCATIIALSEDYRNRVWEERQNIATDVVAKWDIGTYRLAEARLKVLSQEPAFVEALQALNKSGITLGRSWRLRSADETAVDAAWAAHRDTINRFIAASSQVVDHPSTRNPLRRSVRTKAVASQQLTPATDPIQTQH